MEIHWDIHHNMVPRGTTGWFNGARPVQIAIGRRREGRRTYAARPGKAPDEQSFLKNFIDWRGVPKPGNPARQATRRGKAPDEQSFLKKM